MNLNTIYYGDVRQILASFPGESIDMVITSPPYWSQRNYKTEPQIWDEDPTCKHNWIPFIRHGKSGGKRSKMVHRKGVENFQIVPSTHQKICAKCGAWVGELGQEPTFELFVKHLCDIFDGIKRVLKKTGTCWVNIGDTYASSGGSSRHFGYHDPKYKDGRTGNFIESSAYPQSVMPKSLCCIPDRFKVEMVSRGWLCRSEIIWCKPNQLPSPAKDRFTVDYEKLYFFTKNRKYYFEQQKEPAKYPNRDRGKYKDRRRGTECNSVSGKTGEFRNKRCVWNINTKPSKIPHFASFPPALVEIPIKAGCPVGGVILDPFIGTGTTAIVAKQLNRNYIGIELNPEYIKSAEERIRSCS